VTAPDGEHAADAARRAQREHHAGPIWLIAPRAARAARSSREVGRRHRLAGGQHLAGQGVAGRQHQGAGRVRAVTIA